MGEPGWGRYLRGDWPHPSALSGGDVPVKRRIPLYSLEGVPGADITTHQVSTDDGLDLSMIRFCREESDDVVLVLHGLTTSSDMFIMPEHQNLVSYLLDNGFPDVWTLDYRMSNRHPYNRRTHQYTMDDVALYDFPAALRELRQKVGSRRIHVVAHCLGSVSFLMSLFGGAVTGHQQRHREQRRAHTSGAGVVEGQALVRADPDGEGARPAGPRPEVAREPEVQPWPAVLQGGGPVPQRVRRPRLPHAQPHVGHRLARAVQPRQDARGHARTQRGPLRPNRFQLLPAHPRYGQGRPRGAVRSGRLALRRPAPRLPAVPRRSPHPCC